MKFHEKLWQMVLNQTAFSYEHNGVRHIYVHDGIYAGLWRYNKSSKLCMYNPVKIVAEKQIHAKTILEKNGEPLTKTETLPMPILFYSGYSAGNPKKAYLTAKKQVVFTIASWKKFCARNSISGTLADPASTIWTKVYSSPGSIEVAGDYLTNRWIKNRPPAWRKKFVDSWSEVGLGEALKRHTRMSKQTIASVIRAQSTESFVGKALHSKGLNIDFISYGLEIKVVNGARRE